MATEVGNTLEPSGVSGTGSYGVDTASVKGDKASESLILEKDEEILRLSIQGFNFRKLRHNGWEKIVILRAGHRKVAIQLLDIKESLLDRKKERSLVIDLDCVVLVPVYLYTYHPNLRCLFRGHENAEPCGLNFETMQDLLKFQEIFTGFRAQTHISDTVVRLAQYEIWNTEPNCTAIQLWSKKSTQQESLNRITDRPHNKHHARYARKGRPHANYEGSSTNIDPTSASDLGLNPSDGSGIETQASSFLVFARKDSLPDPLLRIPLDSTFSVKGQCRCKQSEGGCRHITLVENNANTESQQTPSFQETSALRSGVIDCGAVAPSIAMSRSSSNITGTIMQGLSWVQLEFKTIEDKMLFEDAFDALKRQHGPHPGEEKLRLDYQSSKERRPHLRRLPPMKKFDWTAVDAENLIATVAPKGANTDITPFCRTKAEEGASIGPLPGSPRALARHSCSLSRERPDKSAFVAGRLDPIIELDKRNWSSNGPDDGQQDSIRPSVDKAIRDADPNLRLLNELPRPGSLQCPFHFLGCKEEFHIWRERQWVKHSLTHFQTHGARRFLARRVEPPKSCRCYFCKTKFSSLSGTACWKDYMNHIRHCGFGHQRVPPDAKLIEYLWQEGLIDGETYQDLISIEHPPIHTFETNLAEEPAFIEFESSASSVSETSECEEQSPRSEMQVTSKIQRASIETLANQEQWRRRICRRIVVFKLWKREQDVCIPNELWSSPASFEFINVVEMSTFDKIKGLFETYSGREWNWWPFSAPAKPLESGKVRIRWQCACGDKRWTDASKYLSRKCQALVNENTTAEHEHGNATSYSVDSVASHSQFGSVIPGSFPSDASQLPGDTSNMCFTAQASHIQNAYNNSNSKDLYVLFCIYQKSQILHSQILATKCQNDEAFFENLRREYRRLRGFFRFWFSPLQFSHCNFVRFTRFYVNELANVGHSLPIDLIYEYSPRPPGPHDNPPISPHEFRRRFYTPLANPCGRSEALERIPKRQKRFQINLHVDGREDMWGLHVELQPCFLVVLMWQIAITAGGWAFMAWWLSRHKGDLQNAAMPVTLIVTAMMALWAPIGKGMRETL